MTSRRIWALAALGLALLACDPGGDGPEPTPEDGAVGTPDAMLDVMPDAMDGIPDAMADGLDAMAADAGSADGAPSDAGGSLDATADAMRDASADAMLDAMPDAMSDAMPDMAPPGCEPGVEVSGDAPDVPAAAFGHYVEAIDCARGEGGAWFGGDFTRCFRKADGSAWRVWNTGCGWVIGEFGDGPDPAGRVLMTYTGQCAEIPPRGLDTRALTTGVLYDGFGRPVDGVRVDHCPDPTPCAPGLTIAGEGAPADALGGYRAAVCGRADGGAWFGGVDYALCYDKADDSGWRVWNTGCGWELGRQEGLPPDWRRVARTYSGRCDAMPIDQREPAALTRGVLYDGFGDLIEGLRFDHCRTPSDFAPGVRVIDGAGRPRAFAGHYAEARDCTRDEGGAWFGGDYTRCFRKTDRSGWLIWNTGCGWELGRQEARGQGWSRVARTYSGVCADMPHWQLDLRGLGGYPLFDGFGDPVEGVRFVHTPEPGPCADSGATVSLEGDAVPAEIAGHYTEARDCRRDEGGAWFGGDYTRCFRKSDGSPWRIWNTGCGWEIGRIEGADGWRRYARTYSGVCADMPPLQLDGRALTRGVLFDGFGNVIAGLRVDHCEERDWAWRY